jgi:hypothetical protein
MSRLLLPREHGAYVQLLAPLTLAFVLTGGSLAAGLLAGAAIVAFVANEPLLVVLGHRGKRASAQNRSRAMRMLAVLIPTAVALGMSALWLVDWPTRALTAGLLVPAAALVALGVKRQQRTVVGEVFALVSLAGAAVPVATAAGMSPVHALTLLGAWVVGYGCSVVCVHRVIDRGRRPRSAADITLAIVFFGITCAAVLVSRKTFAFSPAVPLALAAGVVAYLAPPPARLRTIGFAMVGASCLSLVAPFVIR